MRRLLTGYAVTFNRRHRRYGRLFQNRYKSILCQENTYLLELVRYIHLNPIRAGIVKDLKSLFVPERIETRNFNPVINGDSIHIIVFFLLKTGTLSPDFLEKAIRGYYLNISERV